MRILIVSYYFPPYMNVGGFRALSWARAFHDEGHDVVVIHGDGKETDSCTFFPEEAGRPFRAIRVHNPRLPDAPLAGAVMAPPRLASRYIRRLLETAKDAIKPFIPVADLYGTWANNAIAVAEREVSDHGPFDAIISTSFPLSAHTVAMRLRIRHGGVWSADFRDFFGQSDSTRLARGTPRTVFLRHFVARIGRRADLVTTVSRDLSVLLAHHIPEEKIAIVYNGYFEEHLPTGPAGQPVRRILYTGSYNATEFTLEPVIKALALLREDGYRLPMLSFVGGRTEAVAALLQEAGLEHEFLPGMVNREVLRLQRDSALLLLCDTMSGPGALLTKTFEYLAVRRPVIVITRPGSGLSTTIFAPSMPGYSLSLDPREIAAFIRAGLEGGIPDSAFYPAASIRTYAREVQARTLLERLKRLSGASA